MQIFSDLHLEHRNIDHAINLINDIQVTSDILVMPGDIHNQHIHRCLTEFSKKWRLVIFTPGNHEYYGERFRYQNDRLYRIRAEHPNVIPLLNTVYKDDVTGIVFAGCTLWFPNNSLVDNARHRLNDFHKIKEHNHIFELNAESQYFIKSVAFKEADVIVTHHAPSQLALNKMYHDDVNLNACYYTPMLDNLRNDIKPKTWIHGHTHVSHDFVHPTGVRIIANCAGYDWNTENYDPMRVYNIKE